MFRRSPPEVFYKNGVLKSFAKFTGKHQCQSLFFNEILHAPPATLLKKELWSKCFSFYERPQLPGYAGDLGRYRNDLRKIALLISEELVKFCSP